MTRTGINRKERLKLYYNPGLFEKSGSIIIESLAEYYRQCQSRATQALPWQDPEKLTDIARDFIRHSNETPFDEDSEIKRFEKLNRVFLDSANHLHAPSYMGHQLSPAIPLSGLIESLGSHCNQGMAVYEMGPFATASERAVIECLGRKIGWPDNSFGGIATHGGALGNITALLAARNVRYSGSWENGLPTNHGHPAVVVSPDGHYSIARSAGVIGIGTHHVIRAPLDLKRRIDPDALEQTLINAKNNGLDVFCLVASACSTPTGAFDPIGELAEIASKHRIWLHVDGAHGASVLMSRKHRHLVEGISHADSITWDAHKMLFTPALCTFLFFKDKGLSFQTFRQDAPYLFDPENPGNLAEFDSAVRTVECTKRGMAMGVFGLLSVFGEKIFEDLVDETFELTHQLYQLINQSEDFVAVHKPQANILCFQYVPSSIRDSSHEEIGAFQIRLRKRLIESGTYYITQTKLDGTPVLRVTLMNPLSNDSDLSGLLDALRHYGSGILKA